MGPLIPLFKTFGDVCSGYQSQGRFSHLCALSPAGNGFLRFTSGETPVDLLKARMAAEPFQSTYLHWRGSSPASDKTDNLPTELSRFDVRFQVM